MLRSLLSGLVLALCAAVVVLIGGGSELEHIALLGAALGGVIGLVPNDSLPGKLGGFALGFAIAWAAFGIRALFLPDSPTGRAVAAFLVILICGVVAAVSAGKVPLWSTLLGAAAIVGAYETLYTNAPSQFLSTSPQAATTVLLAAGFGFIGSTIITTFLKRPEVIDAISAPAPYSVSTGAVATSTLAAFSAFDSPEPTSMPAPYRAFFCPEATSMPDSYSVSAGPQDTSALDSYSVSAGPQDTSALDPYGVSAGPQDTSALDPYSLPALPEATSTPDSHPAPTGIQDTLWVS